MGLRKDYADYRSFGHSRYRSFLLALLDLPLVMKVLG